MIEKCYWKTYFQEKTIAEEITGIRISHSTHPGPVKVLMADLGWICRKTPYTAI